MDRYPDYCANASVDAVRQRAREATADAPLRVVFSACLLGNPTGWEGGAYTDGAVQQIAELPNVEAIAFCPEDLVLGTPRPLTICHGGDGFAVVDGFARVMDEAGRNVSDEIIRGARAMVDTAQARKADLAILMDISDSCGSNVIYRGAAGTYQPGPGVAAALMRRAGIPTLAQTDAASLGRLRQLLDPPYEPPPGAVDRVDKAWFRENMPFVREESVVDRPLVDALVGEAFGGTGEVELVRGLRKLDGTLMLVATVNGNVAGHIAFSRVSLPGVYALAPMAVAGVHQRSGVGTAMVREGLRRLRKAGAAAVLVLGHPGYYPRFGFVPADGIPCPWPGVGDAWMVLPLGEDVPQGLPVYPEVFTKV